MVQKTILSTARGSRPLIFPESFSEAAQALSARPSRLRERTLKNGIGRRQAILRRRSARRPASGLARCGR